MANSEFSYVRAFEQADALAPANWLVVRIDGRAYSKLCKKYAFAKPNDGRAIALMNAAAAQLVRAFPDVVLAYGQSDEYSFVFHEATLLFDRRAQKLATSVSTMFTAEYCMQWPRFFGAEEAADGESGVGDGGEREGEGAEAKGEVVRLERPWPTFDGRVVAYPKRRILRDYLAWRQADCHVNNLYNTTFWSMVLKGGMGTTEAEEELKGTLAADKNEILFSRFGINYNSEPLVYRKGTVIYRDYRGEGEIGGVEGGVVGGALSKTQMEKERKRRQKAAITVEHVDIIGDAFWDERPFILAPKRGGSSEE